MCGTLCQMGQTTEPGERRAGILRSRLDGRPGDEQSGRRPDLRPARPRHRRRASPPLRRHRRSTPSTGRRRTTGSMLTARLFEAVFLGTKDEAGRALEFTRRKHATVVGAMPEDAGAALPGRHALQRDRPASDVHDDGVHLRLGRVHAEPAWCAGCRPTRAKGCGRTSSAGVSCSACPARPRRPPIPSSGRASTPTWPPDKPYLTDEARVVGSYLAGAKRGDYDMAPPLRPLFRVSTCW